MRRRPTSNTALLISGVLVATAGCSATSDDLSAVGGEVVYGADDRRDYFDLTDDAARDLVSGSMVALVSNAKLDVAGGDLARAPSWGHVDGLCPGEPFASQPAGA